MGSSCSHGSVPALEGPLSFHHHFLCSSSLRRVYTYPPVRHFPGTIPIPVVDLCSRSFRRGQTQHAGEFEWTRAGAPQDRDRQRNLAEPCAGSCSPAQPALRQKWSPVGSRRVPAGGVLVNFRRPCSIGLCRGPQDHTNTRWPRDECSLMRLSMRLSISLPVSEAVNAYSVEWHRQGSPLSK